MKNELYLALSNLLSGVKYPAMSDELHDEWKSAFINMEFDTVAYKKVVSRVLDCVCQSLNCAPVISFTVAREVIILDQSHIDGSHGFIIVDYAGDPVLWNFARRAQLVNAIVTTNCSAYDAENNEYTGFNLSFDRIIDGRVSGLANVALAIQRTLPVGTQQMPLPFFRRPFLFDPNDKLCLGFLNWSFGPIKDHGWLSIELDCEFVLGLGLRPEKKYYLTQQAPIAYWDRIVEAPVAWHYKMALMGKNARLNLASDRKSYPHTDEIQNVGFLEYSSFGDLTNTVGLDLCLWYDTDGMLHVWQGPGDVHRFGASDQFGLLGPADEFALNFPPEKVCQLQDEVDLDESGHPIGFHEDFSATNLGKTGHYRALGQWGSDYLLNATVKHVNDLVEALHDSAWNDATILDTIPDDEENEENYEIEEEDESESGDLDTDSDNLD